MLLGVVDKLGETLQAPEDTPNRLGADVGDPLIVGLVHEDLIWKGQASGCPVHRGFILILYTNGSNPTEFYLVRLHPSTTITLLNQNSLALCKPS